MNVRNAIGLVLGLLLAGCADPSIVGDWEGGNEIVDVALSVETDLTGTADVFVQEDGGIECLFSVAINEHGGELYYEMKMTEIGSDTCGGKIETLCRLDGDKLECEADGGPSLVLVRK